MNDWFKEFKGKYAFWRQDVIKQKIFEQSLSLKNQNFDEEAEIKLAVLTYGNILVTGTNNTPEK